MYVYMYVMELSQARFDASVKISLKQFFPAGSADCTSMLSSAVGAGRTLMVLPVGVAGRTLMFFPLYGAGRTFRFLSVVGAG